uniref:Uncharacterized protein n=1 Tax=uncultured SAR11 cluster alpha proteobacterium H17925_45G17 TaxID=715038 RepID=E7CA25_9PROT|nr:hypothetical protein [uncultured SAR11 cluster alpha proteobacterium H17925_45G17]
MRAKFCPQGNRMFPQLGDVLSHHLFLVLSASLTPSAVADKELHFGYQRNGSLVVARSEEDEAILEVLPLELTTSHLPLGVCFGRCNLCGTQDLLQRGHKNGVEGLRIVDQTELRCTIAPCLPLSSVWGFCIGIWSHTSRRMPRPHCMHPPPGL